MTMKCYNKLFISEIRGKYVGENPIPSITRTVMKSSILGVITGIQKFSRKTLYTVDDGTASLDCVLWHHEQDLEKKISKLRLELESGNSVVDKEAFATSHLLLNKVEMNQDAADYNHGDTICCLGIVKVVKGKLLLDITHHYKIHTANAETLWIFDVLSCHQRT